MRPTKCNKVLQLFMYYYKVLEKFNIGALNISKLKLNNYILITTSNLIKYRKIKNY